MKRYLIAAICCFVFALIVVGVARADCMDFVNPLLHKYDVEIEGQVFTLSFESENLVDCPIGTATISYELERDGWTRTIDIETVFETNHAMILIEGFGYGFIGADENLYIIPAGTPFLRMDKIDNPIHFPW